MSPAFLKCVADVLQVEAGYQCVRADRGNWSSGQVGVGRLIGTNRGISAPVLVHWRKGLVTAADMRALTREEALAIYQALYWAPLAGDELPLPVAYVCFDAEVMSGLGTVHEPRTAAWLQTALHVDVDSQIGPQTIATAQACDQVDVVRSVCAQRLEFLESIPDWPEFGHGWGARVQRVQTVALDLIQT